MGVEWRDCIGEDARIVELTGDSVPNMLRALADHLDEMPDTVLLSVSPGENALAATIRDVNGLLVVLGGVS